MLKYMRLNHQTGISTFIQFLVLSFLALGSQIFSAVDTCHKDSLNCVSNLITSIIFYILVAIVFGGIWLIGYAAQEMRNKWLARLLICIEGLIALVALFSIKLSLEQQPKNILTVLAGFSILVIAVWTITLAWQLLRSQGKRIGPGRRRSHAIKAEPGDWRKSKS